ncbi:MAG: efflux transporter outer membrane subunit [Burkholderiales bacterium]|nr:efflux transporter outer membrane subunit [Burkholderiales bacterium]
MNPLRRSLTPHAPHARLARFVPLVLPLVAALVLAGCATTTAPLPEALPEMPATFKEGGTAWTRDPAPAPQGAWWQAFADPALDALIERATSANTSVQAAAARLAQARALLRSADAERAPQVGVGAGATREAQRGLGVAPGTVLSAGASLSYEVDLVGRLAGASNAAALDARAREALLRSTQLLVQSQVAQAYFGLRALDTERMLVRDTVAAYRDTQDLIERRLRAGDVAELDLARVRSEVAATEAEALALERQRALLEHALALLVGAPASAFRVADTAEWAAPLPQVPTGVPSTVLARRPDIAAAQDGLRAAQARVGVAQAAWFPSLSLTGSGGIASPELSDLFRSAARAWSVGALLALPIFDGGRREAGVASAQAGLDAAWVAYREQLLVAFKDVEDELVALRLLDAQGRAQAQAVDAATRATTLSEVRYRNGLVSQLELLDARRSELRNRRQALQVKAARYQATVGLIRALGGGWG